ncbi:MAG: hypothetical protein AABW54_02240 [Candidatus Micrarchaeota archaeon]
MAELYRQAICEKSFKEMLRFVSQANGLGEAPLLFGGWAVYYYHQYAGSKDVDFAVSDKFFEPLYDFLVKDGYTIKESRLVKGGVIFDIYEQSGEIHPDAPPLKLLYEGSERVYLKKYASIIASGEVLIPSKPMLLYFKISALSTRSVPKDRNDVIALLLKADEEELSELSVLLSKPELKTRLSTLRNDEQGLALVTAPTQRNLNLLNSKIKRLVGMTKH